MGRGFMNPSHPEELTRAAKAPEVSELRYRRLFEAARDGILILDAGTGRVVDANPFLVRLLGYSHDALVGKAIWELGFLRDVLASREKFAELQRREYVRYENLPLEAADGRRCEVEFVSNVYLEGQKKVIQCNIRDITERARMESSLKESASFLNTLLEAMPVPVFYKDVEGRYTGVNRAFETFFGKTRAAVVGKTVFDIAPPDWAEVYHARDLELFHKPGMQVYEAKVKDARGRMRDVVFHKATFTGPDGKVGGLIGVILEITERVQAEAARIRLATAVEQSAETILITDADGTILYANPAFERTSGYTCAEAIGQNPRILSSGRQDAEFYRDMWATLKRGEVWSGRLTNRRKDGTLYEEEASISPVRDAAGTIINYVASQRDVTHMVQLEGQLRQAQKMEAVGRLAGGVAHDFNNLLTGIMGYAELCLDEIGPDHPVRQWLEEIKVEVARSAEITRQLLAFARKQTVAPKVVNLNDAVAGMLNLMRRLVGEHLQLAWLPGPGLWPVRIDPSQVDQILANLCVNARDAIDGAGQIHLATENATVDAEFCAGRADALPGDYALLSVTDSGRGMDKETLAQIFEPFFTTKGLGKGTGLGLATVYGIVKQNNGFIHVYSELGKGTAFRIYLPRVAAEAGPDAARPAREAPRGAGETVLVVEDEKSLRELCARLLDHLGYDVLAAETPGEALETARKHEGGIQLLLTDVVMPGMDGKQLARRITALKSGIRVLYMSGYTADVIAQRGVLEQNTDFLQKPFTRLELATKVHEVLKAACAP
jgi:two-component system, cell cycle sensor histidine kinase and response regulator CckA